jgi:glucose-fructose oxidoreductase
VPSILRFHTAAPPSAGNTPPGTYLSYARGDRGASNSPVGAGPAPRRPRTDPLAPAGAIDHHVQIEACSTSFMKEEPMNAMRRYAPTRRELLRLSVGFLAGAIGFPRMVSAAALGKAGGPAPSDRVTVGCIGTGGMGRYDMSRFLQSPDSRVVAVCDVKRDAREAAREQVDNVYRTKTCAAYNDFRELVARSDIDACLIASTDHWHVLHALAAVRSGKDVYIEKPLGLSLQEITALRDEVERYGRIFQFGTQQRSMPQFRLACELVLNGRIGKLGSIRVSAPSGFAERTGEATYAPVPVPEGFDYDFWLGPAPWAPYVPKRVINPHWFHMSDYSLGYVAGWGIHHVDIAQWGNGTELTGPIEVEGSGVYPSNDGMCDNALTWDVTLRYANGVRMHFTSDGLMNDHGIRFEGTGGWVYVNRSVLDANPKSLLEEKFGPNEIHLPRSEHHQQNFLDCVRSRGRTVSPIDVAVRSDTICHLSDIAMRLGRKLSWDPVKEVFAGDAEANRRLRRAMRSPWHL